MMPQTRNAHIIIEAYQHIGVLNVDGCLLEHRIRHALPVGVVGLGAFLAQGRNLPGFLFFRGSRGKWKTGKAEKQGLLQNTIAEQCDSPLHPLTLSPFSPFVFALPKKLVL